jgi:hypothetical protein
VAEIDEEDVLWDVPERTYDYGGTGFATEAGHGDSGLEYIQRLFHRCGK